MLPQQDGPTFHSAFLPASCSGHTQGGGAAGAAATSTISGSLAPNGQAGEKKVGGTKPGNLFHQDTPSVALDSSGLSRSSAGGVVPVVTGPASSSSSSNVAAATAAQLA